MNHTTTIHWFRRDLRLSDNPAWQHALDSSERVIPIYLHSPTEDGKWTRGGASKWWLHQALEDLSHQLEELDCPLVILNTEGSSLETLSSFAKLHGVTQVSWNRCYEPAAIKRDTAIKSALSSKGITVSTFNGSLLFDPLKITNTAGTPFKVFTPFWKHCCTLEIPVPTPRANKLLQHSIQGSALSDLQILPTITWNDSIADAWNATRSGAEDLLQSAIHKAAHYQDTRDMAADDGTSRLSPYLHFGQIGPREFYHTILTQSPEKRKAVEGILRQLFWREFSAHLLYHFPHSQDDALKPDYQLFPWQFDENLTKLWQQGKTGYPIIDAGMRQLWQTGWMHNRVRMIVGSFLVKHLLQPWQEGAWWFWDTLVDADLANNTMGWQWLGGCGADASPYFRVFNPILQSQKFDPDAEYIKRWLPELKDIPAKQIHTIWEMAPLELAAAGVTLGKDYPFPIISHEAGRQKALNAYAQFKGLLDSK